MSFLSSLFPTSSGTPANAGQAPTSGISQNQQSTIQQGQQGTANSSGAQASGTGVAADTTKQAAPDPLDKFIPLWQTPTTADGKPAALPVDPLTQQLFNFDPTKVQEAANKMDFSAGITPELAAKALGGDVSAFGEAINLAVRQAVVGMTMSQGNLLNQALLKNNQNLTASLPQHINRVRLLEDAGDNPVFSHPAAQPLINSLKQMAFAKDPNASPAEVNRQIQEYMLGLSTALVEGTPQKVAERKTAAKGEMDWTTYLGQ